jgi:hypothetical protein
MRTSAAGRAHPSLGFRMTPEGWDAISAPRPEHRFTMSNNERDIGAPHSHVKSKILHVIKF